MAIIVQLDGRCRVLVFRHTLSRKEALLKSKPFCLLLVLGAMYLNPQARASELQQPQDITISASPVTLAATGDWKRSTFDDLPTDAIAAVRYLKTRPEIAAHRIGLRGRERWIEIAAGQPSADDWLYFPDGDHDLRSTKAPKVDGRAPLVAGYLEMTSAWALSH